MLSICVVRVFPAMLALAGAVALYTAPAAANDGGDWANERLNANDQSRAGSKRSSLGRTMTSEEAPRSLTGGITWQASAGCVPGRLRGVLNDVAATYGAVKVTSTCRSRSANRAAGGASQSYHLSGEAVDFRVSGNTGSVYAYLSRHSSVGGFKHYGGGLFHIDTGPRRPF